MNQGWLKFYLCRRHCSHSQRAPRAPIRIQGLKLWLCFLKSAWCFVLFFVFLLKQDSSLQHDYFLSSSVSCPHSGPTNYSPPFKTKMSARDRLEHVHLLCAQCCLCVLTISEHPSCSNLTAGSRALIPPASLELRSHKRTVLSSLILAISRHGLAN